MRRACKLDLRWITVDQDVPVAVSIAMVATPRLICDVANQRAGYAAVQHGFCFRLPLSLRTVENLLAARGIMPHIRPSRCGAQLSRTAACWTFSCKAAE